MRVVHRDKHAETGISRLIKERNDYFYRSFGTGALEDLKWGQGNRVKKGIHIVRRSRDAVTLEGEDKPLVFRLSGEMQMCCERAVGYAASGPNLTATPSSVAA